jgi:hypothetical protein
MKKKSIHLYGASIKHTYTTACGLQLFDIYDDTIIKKKVICKRCKKTKLFKGKNYPH